MLKVIKFYFYYFKTKKRLNDLFRNYLMDKEVSLSLLFKEVTIPNYKESLVSKLDDFVIFLNQGLEYFTIDSYSVNLYKITLRSSHLPEIAKIPRSFKADSLDIILGVDENKKVVTMSTKLQNTILLNMLSGSGKTYAIKAILNGLREARGYRASWNGFSKVVAIDVKNDGSFDEYEGDNFIICKNKEHFLEYLENLNKEVLAPNYNKPVLLVLDEVFLWSTKSLFSNKEDRESADRIANFLSLLVRMYRSKRICAIFATQSPNITSMPIDPTLISLKVFSYVRREVATPLGIQPQYQIRPDLKFGKFLLLDNGNQKLVRFLS